jgi:hypothetical protein
VTDRPQSAAITSDEYAELAALLARKIVELLSSAKQRSMAPPLELHVSSADDDVVVHCLCHHDTTGEIQLQSMVPEMKKLNARFPLTATVTDANGESLEMTIAPKQYPVH